MHESGPPLVPQVNLSKAWNLFPAPTARSPSSSSSARLSMSNLRERREAAEQAFGLRLDVTTSSGCAKDQGRNLITARLSAALWRSDGPFPLRHGALGELCNEFVDQYGVEIIAYLNPRAALVEGSLVLLVTPSFIPTLFASTTSNARSVSCSTKVTTKPSAVPTHDTVLIASAVIYVPITLVMILLPKTAPSHQNK